MQSVDDAGPYPSNATAPRAISIRLDGSGVEGGGGVVADFRRVARVLVVFGNGNDLGNRECLAEHEKLGTIIRRVTSIP